MIVVTGGAGFIGSNLVAGLEARGEREIVVVDRLGCGDKWRNIAKRELADLVHPDRFQDWLDRQRGKIRTIFHLGAISSTTESDADLIAANNFSLSLELWRWCARNQTRFIYASSAATYGDGSAGFEDDGTPAALAKLMPLNPYGWSKHLFDRRVARLAADPATRPPAWAGLKFFNVYGPNEYHKGGQISVAWQIHERLKAGEKPRLFRSHHPDYGDGGQLRDFIWVGDCVEVMLWMSEQASLGGLFNIGTGKARSFADLARAVAAATNSEPAIEYVDTPPALRPRYQYFTEARMDRLRQAGYRRPFTAIEDGVGSYVHDFLRRDDPYR
ncbi:MAG: ADP-glyceromanno-heptose 6-epimerase [Proteobacteria bacterium]|nr:ADP-glyceromanno-heptose 6-epimerase [Pseudomonadota bacterium]MBI3497640.1 ADP-glyceromanno-heptose 6-epimerase [Pseudomonadota bacterium]